MSFMIVQCAWCGETYTFGIVGTAQIGSGHKCEAVVECKRDGCSERATRQISLDYNAPGSWSGPYELVCPKHAAGITIGWQPGVTQ